MFRYKNGHKKDITVRYLPASSLWKKRLAQMFPNNRKKTVAAIPVTRQKYDVRRISFLICFLFPDECAFETAGRSIVDIAIVIVAGNIINGIAIPEYIPYTLMNFFPDDFLLIIDESHVTIPQVRGMYAGDRSRKKSLIDNGFRLPSAYDNRPLNFEEFEENIKMK